MALDFGHSSKKAKSLSLSALFFVTATNSGCASLGGRALERVISLTDTRSHDHAFYAQVRISFKIGNTRVYATRYSDIYYITTHGELRFPPCDASKATCWNQTNEYFLGLPNGDIAIILVTGVESSLQSMIEGVPVHASARLAIFRDQPKSISAHDHGTCLGLSVEDSRSSYNIPSIVNRSSLDLSLIPDYSTVNIELNETRVDDIYSKDHIIDEDSFNNSWTLDKNSCEYLIHRYKLMYGVVFHQE